MGRIDAVSPPFKNVADIRKSNGVRGRKAVCSPDAASIQDGSSGKDLKLAAADGFITVLPASLIFPETSPAAPHGCHRTAAERATLLSRGRLPCSYEPDSSRGASASLRTRARRRIRSARLNSPPKMRTRAARYMKYKAATMPANPA
jgi:hypothetical protein